MKKLIFIILCSFYLIDGVSQNTLYYGIENHLNMDKCDNYTIKTGDFKIFRVKNEFLLTPLNKTNIVFFQYKNDKIMDSISYKVISINDFQINAIGHFNIPTNCKPDVKSKILDSLLINYELIDFNIIINKRKCKYSDFENYKNLVKNSRSNDTIVLNNFIVKYNSVTDTISKEIRFKAIDGIRISPHE